MSLVEKAQPAQLTAFKNLVQEHVKTISQKRWQAYRKLAEGPSQIAGGPVIPADVDQPELVRLATSAADMPLSAVLRARGEWEMIGFVQAAPAYFNKTAGIYAWSPTVSGQWCLQLWLTSPAYPPGWD
jgi:hypothetical protein